LTKNHEQVAPLISKRAEVFYVSDDSESGTALLEAAEKIKRDFILMSCDIMVGVNLLDLLDFHYKGKAAITCLIKEEDLDKKLGKAPVSCNLDDSFEIMFIGSD
jgi:translation initiation factor eIF-2B subunit gamma